MGGKARWRKLRRVVGVQPLGCHAPSRQRFKQDRAKTRDAKTIRDQARSDGEEGVEVDVLERMGVTAKTESKRASKVEKEQSSNDKIEIEIQDVAVNGKIIVHVRSDVDEETMDVNGKVEHTEVDKDVCRLHLPEQHDRESAEKDHEAFRETEISVPTCTDFSDKPSFCQEGEFKRTDRNQTSITKIVHFSNEPAKIIDDQGNEDDDSDTDRTVTPSPCSPNMDEEVQGDDRGEGFDEVRTGEGMNEEDDDHGRLETIEESQKESYDEGNQGQTPDSQDLMGAIDTQEKDHGREAFMLCLNDTTVVIDGLSFGSVEDTDILMPYPDEVEETDPDQDEVLEFYADNYSLKPPVLVEGETRIRPDFGDTIESKFEKETTFITTTENTSDEHVNAEGMGLRDDSEFLKSTESYSNFKELTITDKSDAFLQSEDKEESVSINNDEVRYTAASRLASDTKYDILDDSLSDYCVSKNVSMEVNTTESVKFFLSDSELSDNEYQTKYTDADINDRIQPRDWVERMDEDEHKEGENTDRQDETDDMTDVVIYDLDDTDDEAPSQMDEDDEQNRTTDGEEKKEKEADQKKYDTEEKNREEERSHPEYEERCATLMMLHLKSDQENLAEDGQTYMEYQRLPENRSSSPKVLKSSLEDDEEAKIANKIHDSCWKAPLNENHFEKSHNISEKSQRSTVAEEQVLAEDKQCFLTEPEVNIRMRHWEARQKRRKLVQSCTVLDEQVFAAYRKNFTPCEVSSSAAGKYPVLYKETYENDLQSLQSSTQSSTGYENPPASDRCKFGRQQMNSVVEIHNSKDDQPRSMIKDQDEEEDKQFSIATRRDSIDNQQNSLMENRNLDYQQFISTRGRNSIEGYQESLEVNQSSEGDQFPKTKEWISRDNKQCSAMEEDQSLEEYQQIYKSRRDAVHDPQNMMVKEHSEAYQQYLTRKLNSVEIQNIHSVGEQLSEDYQEIPPTKRRNSIEEEQILTMEKKTSMEDRRFPRMGRQKSTEEKRYSGMDRQFPETKRQNSVEDKQSSMMERQYTMPHQESPTLMRQTSMEEQQFLPIGRQAFPDQQSSVLERRSMGDPDNSAQEIKYTPDRDDHCNMQNYLSSLDRQVLKDEKQTFVEERNRQDTLHCQEINISNTEEDVRNSEVSNTNPDNQELSYMNTVTKKEEEQLLAIDGTTRGKYSKYRVGDMPMREEGPCSNMDIKNVDDDIPCLAMNRDDSSEKPRSLLNRLSSADDEHHPEMNTKNSEVDKFDSMEGEALRPDEQYPVIQRQYSTDEQQIPLLQTQNSVESEKYSVVDGLKIRDSFDLYDRKISSPPIESAYGDRLSLPRDLQYLALSDESKAEIQPQVSSIHDHYEYKTESTSLSPRVSKISMPFSIVDTFDVDTNEDKRSCTGEDETSATITDQSDPVVSSYPLTPTCQDSKFVMKSEVDKTFLDSGDLVVGKFDRIMEDEVLNRQPHDPPGSDINNDEKCSYFNTPPSFYPYRSPTPLQWGPSLPEDSGNLQYKTCDSMKTLGENDASQSNDDVIITNIKCEDNLYRYESPIKNEDRYKDKNLDELLEDDKQSSQLTSEFQSTPSFDKAYDERSSSDITTSDLYTKGYQSEDGQKHKYIKQSIPDSSEVVESNFEKKETQEEFQDAAFLGGVMKPEENTDVIPVSQDIVNADRATPSLFFPQSAEKLVLSPVNRIDDGKLLNKRRRQRRRTKSTTSSDGESQIFLDFTEGTFANKSESPVKSVTSAESSTRDGLASTDAKAKQDDSKELQSSNIIQEKAAPSVEAFTFAHNPEKSADLDQQNKKRFQRNPKKSKSRRKSDPRELISSLSLDDDKDLTTSVKRSPAPGKSTERPAEDSSSAFPEPRATQKEEANDTLDKTRHATAAGLCKETDKSIKQRQGSPMIKRKPRGYELKRSSSMKTYIREINEESVRSETSKCDLSRSLEASSESIPAPRKCIPSTLSSSMPSQLPQPSVHAPRNLSTDSLQASSTPPNVGQDQMHTPGHPRGVLRLSTQSRKIPTPSAHPSALFLEQPRGLQGSAQASHEEPAYPDSNRNRRSTPAVSTQKEIGRESSPLNTNGTATADKGDASFPSSTGAETPQQQQQLHAPEELSSYSRQTQTTSETMGAKKIRRRRRR